MTHQTVPTSSRVLSIIGAALLAAMVAAEAAPGSDPLSTLRDAIERHERDGDYRSMILAAVELRDTARAPEDRIHAQRSLGRGYALLGDQDRAVEALSEAMGQVRPGMSPTLLAELYRDTAGMLGELGRYEQALSLVERGLGALREENEPDLEAALLVMRGSILGALGRLDEAMASIEQAMDRPLSTPRQEIMRRNNLGMIHKWRGELEPALSAFEAVYRQALEAGSEQLIVYGLLELGDVERLLGNRSDARMHLEDALGRAEAAGEERWQLFAHNYLAELEAEQGNAEAEARHRDAVAAIRSALQGQAVENRARVLEVSLEVLEREREIEQLRMERALQEVQLERGRTLILLAAIAGVLLLFALWLAVQQSRVRASANRELDQLANTDTLTGLRNRRYFIDHLRRRMTDETVRGALILIDVDRFKRVNDDHGHEVGDVVLRDVAQRIQAMMRSEDTVARWGGEEFLAFLPKCTADAALQVAERIREAIDSTPVIHDDATLSVTATLGVAEIGDDGDFERALRDADHALYRGKQSGRNCVRIATPDRSAMS
ncbi:diguanylate cyclase [Wenzhouxiangella sp. XN79A]|uniref:tetratricopeptide repeat-containing diguanylate cyclase n=1 Tax=Wenzhouxiangella sp. XN79A TaxID=2724193 RepID=UPI00144A9F82|nr:diguanylate cyclase [Wenzhouxiangella sp. XN79A]NKI36358.1 diguanylate cyclase [Wenzhouxiangella sp. XN79A]